MIGMDKTRLNYDLMSKIKQDGALKEEWQKLSGDTNNKNSNDSSSQSKKSPLQEQQEKLAQMQASMKANKAQKTNAISRIQSVNSVNPTQEIDTDLSISGVSGFQNSGKFDMKQDIVSFIRPTDLNADNLKKDALGKIGISICTQLEMSGASEGLIHRAKLLFQEEAKVKSIIEECRNELIFAHIV